MRGHNFTKFRTDFHHHVKVKLGVNYLRAERDTSQGVQGH